MRVLSIVLSLAAMSLPSVAFADPGAVPADASPTPPPRPPAPRSPMPPMPKMTRATSPDDLQGTWTVTIRSSLSTCPNPTARREETWSITAAADELTVATATGDLFGPVPVLDRYLLRTSVQPRARASSTVLQVTQSMKERFFGRLVRVESTGKRNDPACVITEDVSGVRAP
ncbi:MAG: hypothetical protein IPQ07_21280 [Myxococcales bacterium]|nr:hypothetical protein [Myxococcales bacterium]